MRTARQGENKIMSQFDDSLNEVLEEIRNIATEALALEVRRERGFASEDEYLEFSSTEFQPVRVEFREAVNLLYALCFADAGSVRPDALAELEWIYVRDEPPAPVGHLSLIDLAPDGIVPKRYEAERKRRAVEARITTAQQIAQAEMGDRE